MNPIVIIPRILNRTYIDSALEKIVAGAGATATTAPAGWTSGTVKLRARVLRVWAVGVGTTTASETSPSPSSLAPASASALQCAWTAAGA